MGTEPQSLSTVPALFYQFNPQTCDLVLLYHISINWGYLKFSKKEMGLKYILIKGLKTYTENAKTSNTNIFKQTLPQQSGLFTIANIFGKDHEAPDYC